MLHTIKNILGIEGAKVYLDIDRLTDDHVGGRCVIISPKAQRLESLKFVLKERYRRGRRKSKLVDTYVLFEETLLQGVELQPDVPFEVTFGFNYKKLHSPIDRFASMNVVTRALGEVAKWVKAADSLYLFSVEARIRGTRLHPFAEVEWSDNDDTASFQKGV